MRPSDGRRFCNGSGRKGRKRPANSPHARTYGICKPFSRAFYRVGHSFVYLVTRSHAKDDIPVGTSVPLDFWDAMSEEERLRLIMALRKPTSQARDAKTITGPVDPAFAQDFPTLCAYLGDDTWEDGSPRLRSTLIVFCEEDLFKLCLTDKDNDQTLWVASKTMWGLLGAIEGRLNDPEAEWRRRKPVAPRKGKGG